MASILDEIVDETVENEPAVSRVAEMDHPGEISANDSVSDTGTVSSSSNSTVQLPPAFSPVGTQSQPEQFDPEIHIVDDNLQPVKNQDGTYRKKRGRKKGGTNASKSRGVLDTDNEKLQRCHASAVVTVQCLFMVGRLIGGDEFTPIIDANTGLNEPQMLTDAWTQYYITADIESVPPWLGVMIATGSYFAARATMPVTQSRMSRLWDWLASFWGEKPMKKRVDSVEKNEGGKE